MAAETQQVEILVTANTQQARTELDKLKGSTEQAAGAMEKKTTAAANGNAAMISFSRIIQDAPFGIIGVANNITMLSEQFVALKTQTGSAGAALQAMKAALYGPMGLTIVISAATTALQFFALASQGAKKAVGEVEAALKKVLDLKNPLEGYKNSMGIVELRNMLFSEKNILKKNETELAQLKRAGYGLGAVDFYASQSGAKTSDGDAIRAIQDRIKVLETENEASLIFIKTAEAEIKAYEKLEAASKVLDRYYKRGNGPEKPADDPKLPELKLPPKQKLEEAKTFLELFKEDVLTQIEIDNLLNKRTGRGVYEEFLKTIESQIEGSKASKKDLLEWLKLKEQINKEFTEDYAVDLMGFAGPFFKATEKLGKQGNRLLAQQMKQRERERLQAEKEAAKLQYETYKDLFINPFVNAFRGEFSKAWNDIFGEATSLFEKFIQGVGEALFQRTTQSIAGGLLNMIFPGAGMLLEGFKPSTNQIIIDGELIATQKAANRNKAILDRQASLR